MSNDIYIMILTGLLAFIIGFLLGRQFSKPDKNGIIVIEPTEDGERERIRFVLDLDLDDIKEKHSITFSVDNHSS